MKSLQEHSDLLLELLVHRKRFPLKGPEFNQDHELVQYIKSFITERNLIPHISIMENEESVRFVLNLLAIRYSKELTKMDDQYLLRLCECERFIRYISNLSDSEFSKWLSNNLN